MLTSYSNDLRTIIVGGLIVGGGGGGRGWDFFFLKFTWPLKQWPCKRCQWSFK